MYIWNVLKLLFLNFGLFGSPSDFLLPACFVLAFLIQSLLLERLWRKRRWFLAAAAGGLALLLEITLHFLQSYTALLLIVLLTYAVVILLGALLGRAVSAALQHFRQKKAASNR